MIKRAELSKGLSIQDVHTEGRGGREIPQICGQTVQNIFWTEGEKGSKLWTSCDTSCMEAPNKVLWAKSALMIKWNQVTRCRGKLDNFSSLRHD